MHQSFLSNRTNAPRSGQSSCAWRDLPPQPQLQQRAFPALQPPHGMGASFSPRRTARHRPSAPLRKPYLFQGEAGSSDASPVGSSRKLDYRVRLLNQDLTPNQQGMPSYMDMTLPSGMILRFSSSTGEVVSVTSSLRPRYDRRGGMPWVKWLQARTARSAVFIPGLRGLMRSIPATSLTLGGTLPGMSLPLTMENLPSPESPTRRLFMETSMEDGVNDPYHQPEGPERNLDSLNAGRKTAK